MARGLGRWPGRPTRFNYQKDPGRRRVGAAGRVRCLRCRRRPGTNYKTTSQDRAGGGLRGAPRGRAAGPEDQPEYKDPGRWRVGAAGRGRAATDARAAATGPGKTTRHQHRAGPAAGPRGVMARGLGRWPGRPTRPNYQNSQQATGPEADGRGEERLALRCRLRPGRNYKTTIQDRAGGGVVWRGGPRPGPLARMTNRAQNKGPDRRRTGAGDPCAAAAGKNRQPRDGPAAGSRGMGPATRAAGPDDRPDLPTESRAGGGLPSAPARGAGPDDQPDARSRAGGGRRPAAGAAGPERQQQPRGGRPPSRPTRDPLGNAGEVTAAATRDKTKPGRLDRPLRRGPHGRSLAAAPTSRVVPRSQKDQRSRIRRIQDLGS